MQREHRQVLRGGRRALALGGALALAFAGSGTAFAATPTNPIASKEWALDILQNAEIHSKFNARGSGVIVAVIDTGVDPNQPDLQGRLVDGVNLTDPSNPTSDFSDQDSSSHGTSIATIIAANPHTDSNGNPDGMVGLADEAKIMPIKAGVNGGVNAESLAAGIDYAVNHGAQVISISEAATVPDAGVTTAVTNALSHGVVVVVGAGNTGENGDQSNTNATIPGVIDVAGIDQNNEIYHPGHYGPDVDVAAPANSIEVGLIGGQYGEYSGTSLATPWVAAEAALIIGLHPTWTSYQVVADIIDNTSQVAAGQTTAGHRLDNYVGYGVIDPVAALGASEPSSSVNPLNGPPLTSTPGANVSSSASASSTGSTSPTAAAKSSSKAPLIIGIAAGVIILVGLLIFLLTRGRNNRGGKGGPGGGGGGNGYNAPQTPPGGQYAQPQQYPQQPNPYQQPQQYPQQGGGGGNSGYGQQPQNPYQGR